MASIPSNAALLKTSTVLCLLILLNSSCKADYVLRSGETLPSGHSLSRGPYHLKIQENCYLVLIDNGVTVWTAIGSHPEKGCHFTLRKDGNLVIISPKGELIWQSGTSGAAGQYVLVLHEDRSVVRYGAAWTLVKGKGKANVATPMEGGVADALEY